MNEKSAFCQYCKRNGSRDDCIDCSAQFDPAGKRISPPSNYVPNSSDNPVEHPAHYTSGGIECIEAIKASMGKDCAGDMPQEHRYILRLVLRILRNAVQET